MAGMFVGGVGAAAGATIVIGGAAVLVTTSAIAITWNVLTQGHLTLAVSNEGSSSGKENTSGESKGESGPDHMVGENGTRTSSKTTWKNGKTERIDVENPAPGERPGQIHYHDSSNNKWYYDIEENVFYNQKTGDLAPKRVQKLLNDKNFIKGIKKALDILGE